MKVRVLSDLHLDVNASHYLELKDKNIFTVICGDTSGDPEITKRWIRKNVNNGLFISGNHLVYNSRRKTVDELREEMADGFDYENKVTYLDCLQNSHVFRKKVENVWFIGTTLYTDFKYCNPQDAKFLPNDPEMIRIRNRNCSRNQMNDYRWGHVRDEHGKIQPLSPENCQEWFEESFADIKKLVCDLEKDHKNDDDLKIFMMTHHCPSPSCIDETYVDSDVNATYVSNLEQFILNHPSIKCWACGHIHKQKIFKIGECLVVMNPRGYCQWCEDIEFSKDLVVDTDTWTVEKPALTAKQIAKNKRRLAMSLAFMSGF